MVQRDKVKKKNMVRVDIITLYYTLGWVIIISVDTFFGRFVIRTFGP